MPDREKVIKGLEHHEKKLTVGETCYWCPYWGDDHCEIQLITDIVALERTNKKIIEKYKKADAFLAIHGWKWEET